MLKGLRWPFLALLLAFALLIVAVVTRPNDTDTPDGEPPVNASTPVPDAITATPPPTSPPDATTLPPADLAAIPPMQLAPENVLVEAVVGEIQKLNPLLATYSPVDRDITALIFEGLTTTNQYGEIVPDLAESWTVTPDGLEYIVALRDDVLWQDGIPFTAEDVAYTFNALSDPDFPGAPLLRDFWQTIEVEPLNTLTVRFRLTQPLAAFPDHLRIGIVPAHVLAGTPVADLWKHPFNLAPIGTGPYQIETLTASQGHIDGIQLRVAPAYRERPEGADGYALDRVIFRAYASVEAALDAYWQGGVNSIAHIPADYLAAVQRIPGLSLYTAVEPHVGMLIYNWKRDSVGLAKNPRARLALAHAVDRNGLVAQRMAGRAIPANSPLLPDSWAYAADIEWPAFDTDRAKTMLEMANLSVSAASNNGEDAAPVVSLTSLSLTILTLDDPAVIALAEGIADGWNELGLDVTVEPVGTVALRARLEAGDFQAALFELSFEPYADPDPYVFWHQGQYGTGQNFGGMDDRRISETLESARRDPLGINRAIHYREFQELFADRAPALPLYYPLYTYAVDTRLQGIQLGFMSSPADRFRNIQDWGFVAAES